MAQHQQELPIEGEELCEGTPPQVKSQCCNTYESPLFVAGVLTWSLETPLNGEVL